MIKKTILSVLEGSIAFLDATIMPKEIIEEEYWIRYNLYSNGTSLIEEHLHGSKIERSIPLFELSYAERSLKEGRFEFYDILPQEYSVIMHIDMETNREEGIDQLKRYLDWIATHVDDTWNIEAWRPRFGKRHYKFSFANFKTAIYFKMVWY